MKQFLALLAFGALCVPQSSAQSPQTGVSVDIPFAFHLGDTPCTPGAYRVRSTDSNTSIFLLEKKQGSLESLFLFPRPEVIEQAPARLVFAKYDAGHIFLRKISFGDSVPSFQLQKSRTEREYVRSWVVITQKAPETVTVLARVTGR
jgi:hypothetical protein